MSILVTGIQKDLPTNFRRIQSFSSRNHVLSMAIHQLRQEKENLRFVVRGCYLSLMEDYVKPIKRKPVQQVIRY